VETLASAPDLTVAELLTCWPQTIPVFLRHRMACVGCSLARFESLAAATSAYGLPLDGFLIELRTSISQATAGQYKGEHL
jgi:hybrid cluster-associated redox disulfide protein